MKKHRYARPSTKRFQPSFELLESRETPATFTVSNLGNAGDGSLRQAIMNVNSTPGPDIIDFSVAGTIQLTTASLPAISNAVKIDGASAPNFAGVPLIQIDAHGFGGLTFDTGSANSTLGLISIVNATGAGVTLNDSNIALFGNYIGLGLDGSTVESNSGDGIDINPTSANNTIGGTASLERNFIAGNGGNGITITGSSRNQILANFIGTDVTGTLALGNLGNGIELNAAAISNDIGGTTLAAGNLISANGGCGLLITGQSLTNFVAGNFIGTTFTGNAPLGNTLDGIAILDGSNDNAIEGTFVDEKPFIFFNVVCANGGNGLRIDDSDNTLVHANYFGLGANDSTALGNALDGALIEGNSSNTQFGGIIPLGDVAAGNLGNGLEIRDTASDTLVFNMFSGVPSFSDTDKVGNAKDGILITSTGSGNFVKTSVFSANGMNGIEVGENASDVQLTELIVGLNTDGQKPIPNQGDGIKIDNNASNIQIGAFQTTIAPRVIDGANLGDGIDITDTAHDIVIIGCAIGVSKANTDLGNQGDGIFVGGGTSNISIGGVDPQLGNVIGANLGNGIHLTGTSNIQIVGNQLGVNAASPPLSLPNQLNGILIEDSEGIVSSVTISGNTILNSGLAGIAIGANTSDASTGITVSQNSIDNNGGLGIDLADDGVTPNDLKDPDVGPNLLQNYPVLQTVTTSGSASTATGILNSLPDQQFRIEFFASPTAAASGFGQGLNYLGSTVVTTDNLGNATFNATGLAGISLGFVMSATATQLATGNTSEFSSDALIAASPATVQGFVFNDFNANGTQDAGEPPLAGQTVYLDLNNNGIMDANEPFGISNGAGNFTITSGATGTFALRQAFADGNQLTAPASGSISVALSSGTIISGSVWGTTPISTTDPVFVASPLFPPGAPNLNTAFLNGVYRNLLNRAPDPAGLSNWLDQLQSGVSESSVVTQITDSQEHRTLQIDSYYESYLDRAADQPGLDNWLNSFAAGQTETEVVAQFLNSSEYQGLHTSNADFVASLYATVLSKPADPAGAALWVQSLENGATRSQVIHGFLASPESETRSIQAFYFAYLQRAADPVGLQNWLDALNGGTTLDAISTNFLTSQEYLSAAQKSVG
jgi:Domain of unknown function (DUF4214)/Right handed beta helix region